MNKIIKKIKEKYRTGFTLVEIVVGVGMLTMFLGANFLYFRKVLDVSQQTTRHIQSGFLLEEGVEAVKLLRDKGWGANIATLTNGTKYYFTWDSINREWDVTTTPQLVENLFTRYFILAAVYRNVGTDNIVPASVGAPDVLDTGTKKVVVTVVWPLRSSTVTSTSSVETYISNIFNN